jgi:arylamine N-acetyltransferase
MMPSEVAESMFWASVGETADGWTKVGEQEGDDGRWTRTISVVVLDPEHNLWAFDYQQGLTENQDNDYPWMRWYSEDPDEIEVYAVRPHVITVTEWVTAE